MAIVRNENVESCMNCKFRDYEQNDNGYACYNTCIRPEGECDFTKRRTGVLDKNGVEIYEGDILKLYENLTMKIVYNIEIIGFEGHVFDIKIQEYIDKGDSTLSEFIFSNYEIIDPDKIETYAENGIEKWRIKE